MNVVNLSENKEQKRLREIYDSFFAPSFRSAEECFAPKPDVTLDEVIAAAHVALEWHRAAEIGFAAERDAAMRADDLNKADYYAQLRAGQRERIEQIKADLETLKGE